jgi:ABC-type branched-subunit amino acid transport system substrate-binding protein
MKLSARAVVIPLLAAAAGGGFVQTACTSSHPAATASDAGEGGVAGVITIGFSNSLTGGLNGLGIPLNDAARVAEQQVNQVGVLGGRQINIEIVDDLSDPMVGAPNAANHFISEKLPAVLGPLSSGECEAVQQLFYNSQVVEISPSATAIALTADQPATNRYFFRTAPADDFQGKAVAKLMYGGVEAIAPDGGAPEAGADGGAATIGGSCRNAYLVSGNDGYGTGLMQVVHDTFLTEPNTTVIAWDQVSTTLAPSYLMETTTIVGKKPDCLVLVAYSDVGAQFMRDLRTAMGISASDPLTFPVYGSDGEYDSAFIPNGESNQGDLTSPNVCATVTGTTPDPAPATPQFQVFQNIWQSSFPGQQPPAYAANLYDAILVLALAIEQAGTATDGQAIRNALFSVTNPNGAEGFGPDKFVAAESAITNGIPVKYIGASGPMTFDQYGNVTGDYIVWRVDKQSNGNYAFDTVGRIPSSELVVDGGVDQ